VVTHGIHAARRTEAGAEAQLRAKNELLRADEEHRTVAEQRQQAGSEAQEAAAQAREAEALRRVAEERQRQVERSLLSVKNEADLQARRLDEARRQVTELEERQQREAGLVAKMQLDLAEADSVIVARESELEQMRGALRLAQGKSESLRRDTARLEEKRGQAALVEVKLRERCRFQENERRRAATQRETAVSDLNRYTTKMQMRATYGPGLADLLTVVERLAAQVGQRAQELQMRVDESRAQSEVATRTLRDRGGAELELQRELDEVVALHGGQQVEHVRFDERKMVLEDELADLRRKHLSPRGLKAESVAGESREVLEAAAVRAEQRRDRIGPVNPLAEQECAEMEERALFLAEQRADLEASIDQLLEVIGGLDEHINGSFAEIFGSIRENFAAVIATVFPGAKGTLSLSEKKTAPRETGESAENSLDEELEAQGLTETVPGISLSVKFPNKAPRSMSLLSGGEKAMTAIAFLFSLFLAHPCPFYLLDEVEASLDDVNIRRFLSLVRKYRDRTQFIIITHQRQTMEVADTLYGVAMESDGVSRVLSRRLGDKKQAHDEEQHGPLAEPLVKEA
jgi:chromosome segregation protein